MTDLKFLQKEVKKAMTEKRFAHTIGVKDTAACLAMRYGADLEQAQTAALLHDYCKCLSDEEMLRQCRRRSLPVSSQEEASPYLLHGKLAAAVAPEKLGVTDPDILGAVTWHTTGRPDMTLLEKIIFTADYMEPGRKLIPGLPKVRYWAFRDLDQTVFLILEHTIQYLEEECAGASIDPATYRSYEFYKQLQSASAGKGESNERQ